MPGLTKEKAGKILRHGSVKGKPLTKKQKGLFGVIRGGKKKDIRDEALRRAVA